MSGLVDPRRVFDDPRLVALSDAAQRGDTMIVRHLLAEGVDPKARGDRDITPLTFALLAPTLDPLRMMLDAGADPNAVQTDGVVPLYYTLVKDDPAWLKVMLDHGADPNAVMPSGSVLEEALLNRNIAAVELLLAKGADPNRKRAGMPLLHTSIGINLPQAAIALVKAGADPEAVDQQGKTFPTIMCETARKHLKHGPEARIYKDYVALWRELVQRGHTPPCPQPF